MTERELFDVKKWMEKESYYECWVEIPVRSDDGSASVETYKLSEIIKDAIAAALAEREPRCPNCLSMLVPDIGCPKCGIAEPAERVQPESGEGK